METDSVFLPPQKESACALHLAGPVEVVHCPHINLRASLGLKNAKRQLVRLNFFHRRQIKPRINSACSTSFVI